MRALLLVLIFATSFVNAAPLAIEVNRGHMRAIPIAILDLEGGTPVSKQLGREISQIVRSDLNSSGLIRPIATGAFLDKQASFDAEPKFADWRIIQSQGVLVGKIDKASTGVMRVEVKLYDAYSEKLMGSIAFTHKSERRIAHKIADYIFTRLTGEQGYFDTQVVYVSEQRKGTKKIKRLTLMDPDGHNARNLTNGRSIVMTPRFSPTERKIAYLDYGRKNTDPKVYIFEPDTNRHYSIGEFPGMTYAPRFSPDGQTLIFSQDKKGYSNLYSMDLKSRKVKRLTFGNVIDTSPSFAPDGSQIVFNSNRGGRPQLYVANANGSGIKRISQGEGSYRTPVWSPRGDLIAFIKITKGNFYIGVMKPDGSGERLLTKGFILDDPMWSANGRMILYTKEEKGGSQSKDNITLNIIDHTGIFHRRVPTPTIAYSGAWSPQLP